MSGETGEKRININIAIEFNPQTGFVKLVDWGSASKQVEQVEQIKQTEQVEQVEQTEQQNSSQNISITQETITKLNEEIRLLKCFQDMFTKTDITRKMCEIIKETGNIELIKYLLNVGVDPHLTDTNGITPLYHALIRERYEIAEILIKNGADVNKAINGEQIIFDLIRHDYIEQLKFLLKNGLDLNVSSEDRDKIVPIGFAARLGKLDIVKLFVEHKADLNKCNSNNQSPLRLALIGRRHDISKYLIKCGANTDILPSFLDMFTRDQNEKMVKLLLKSGLVSLNPYPTCFDFSQKKFIKNVKKQIDKKEKKKSVETSVSSPEKSASADVEQPNAKTAENKPSSVLPEGYIRTTLTIEGKPYAYEGKTSDIPSFVEQIRKVNL